MPNVLTPPSLSIGGSSSSGSGLGSSFNSLVSNFDGVSSRPLLHLTGSRNLATSEVTILCRCTGFPSHAHPIIALFVCRDVRHERDHYSYLGQTQPTSHDHDEEHVECVFKIQDCPPPAPPAAAQEERILLAPQSLGDDARGNERAPEARRGPITQLKLNVYATNTNSAANGFAGGLLQQDMIGTGIVELERLLEQKDDDTLNRGMAVELLKPASAARAHSAPPSELSFTPNFSTPTYSSLSPTLTTSAAYTTLHIPQLSATSASPVNLDLPEAAPATPASVYGVGEDSLKSVHHTPALADDRMHAQHEAFLRRQREELARAERLGAQPIAHGIPRAGKYELGASKSSTLLKHQQSRRMCSTEECVIC